MKLINYYGMAFWAILFYFCFALPAQAERVLVKNNDIQVVIEDEKNWCKDKKAFLAFRSQNPKTFEGARVALQRSIGGARVALGFECPNAETLIINGQSQGKTVFQGQASKVNNWMLKAQHPPAVAKVEKKLRPAEERKGERVGLTCAGNFKTGLLLKKRPLGQDAGIFIDSSRVLPGKTFTLRLDDLSSDSDIVLLTYSKLSGENNQGELTIVDRGVRSVRSIEYTGNKYCYSNLSANVKRCFKIGKKRTETKSEARYRREVERGRGTSRRAQVWKKRIEKERSLKPKDGYSPVRYTLLEEKKCFNYNHLHFGKMGEVENPEDVNKIINTAKAIANEKESSKITIEGVDIKDLENSDYIYDIYQGNFPSRNPNIIDESYFTRYLEFFNSECSSFLPPNRKSYTHFENLYMGSDYAPFRTTNYYKRVVKSVIWMDPRYHSLYSVHYSTLIKEIIAEQLEAMSNISLAEYIGVIMMRTASMFNDYKLILNKSGCENPLLKQFSENLFSFVTGKSTPKVRPEKLALRESRKKLFRIELKFNSLSNIIFRDKSLTKDQKREISSKIKLMGKDFIVGILETWSDYEKFFDIKSKNKAISDKKELLENISKLPNIPKGKRDEAVSIVQEYLEFVK
jgi:hypothetical protein